MIKVFTLHRELLELYRYAATRSNLNASPNRSHVDRLKPHLRMHRLTSHENTINSDVTSNSVTNDKLIVQFTDRFIGMPDGPSDAFSKTTRAAIASKLSSIISTPFEAKLDNVSDADMEFVFASAVQRVSDAIFDYVHTNSISQQVQSSGHLPLIAPLILKDEDPQIHFYNEAPTTITISPDSETPTTHVSLVDHETLTTFTLPLKGVRYKSLQVSFVPPDAISSDSNQSNINTGSSNASNDLMPPPPRPTNIFNHQPSGIVEEPFPNSKGAQMKAWMSKSLQRGDDDLKMYSISLSNASA